RRPEQSDAARFAPAVCRPRARGRSLRRSRTGAMKLRIASCAALPEPDADAQTLAAALATAGIEASVLAWDDATVDWDAPIPTLLRSTWNYALSADAFVAWIDRVARAAPLWNPSEIVRSNMSKRYLYDLEARGVNTVPTRFEIRSLRAPSTPTPTPA